MHLNEADFSSVVYLMKGLGADFQEAHTSLFHEVLPLVTSWKWWHKMGHGISPIENFSPLHLPLEAPPLPPSQNKKNSKNQPFSVNLGNFVPSKKKGKKSGAATASRAANSKILPLAKKVCCLFNKTLIQAHAKERQKIKMVL